MRLLTHRQQKASRVVAEFRHSVLPLARYRAGVGDHHRARDPRKEEFACNNPPRHVRPAARPSWPQRGLIGGNVIFKDRMWILGGGTYDTPKQPERKYFNDVWSSADGVNWECHLDRAPWPPREMHEVAVFDDKMWVMEGFDGANRNDVWYSSDGTHWQELPKTPWYPRHAASVFVHDNALWMVAGNNMESDVWKLTHTGIDSI